MQHFANPGFILVAGLGLSACSLNSQVKVTTSSGVCSAGSIEAGCAAQSSTLLSLTGRRPLAIKSGDTVTLNGTGFNKAMSATIGGIPVTSLDVTSATSASLVVPPGIKTGMSNLKLALTAAEATASVAYSPADGIPLMTVAASEVCSGVAFYDLNGDKQTGTKSCSTPQCTANASVGCVTTTFYKSADFTNLLSSNIKSGVTVAGVAGDVTLPAASDVKSGTTSYGSAGTEFTPSYSPDFPDVANVKTTDTVNGAAGTLDLSNLLAGNIKSGETVAGVAGNVTLPAASDVKSGTTSYGAAGTEFTPSYSPDFPDVANVKTTDTVNGAAGTLDLSNLLAGNIKSGVTVAGVAGEYSFVAPDAWDLRAGTVVGDVTGKLKVNCRNAVKLSGTGSIDNTTSPAGPGSDIWDTIHDYYGLPASTDFPPTWSVANYYCGNVEASAGDDNVWKDVTTAGTGGASCADNPTGSPERCTMQDKISGLKWSKRVTSGVSWQDAITTCNASLHNGQTAGSWRLPTQKELMDAYEHGMVSAASANWMTLVNIQDTFWSASSFDYDYAWIERLADGSTYTNPKIEGRNAVVCVR